MITFPRWFLALALCSATTFAAAQPIGKSYPTAAALVADSDLVVRGKLISVAVNPMSWPGTEWSEATFQADEYLKGTGPKIISFEIRGANNGDPKVHNHVKNGTPLLAFFSESIRFWSRRASRHQYAPRTGSFDESFYDLSAAAKATFMTPDMKPVVGREEIVEATKRAITATSGGNYRIETKKVDDKKVPKGYEAAWVYLLTAAPAPADEILRPDQAARFSPSAQFDGQRILAARGKEAFLWDAKTGKLIQKFVGSTEDVQAVSFCPRGGYDPADGLVLTGSGRPNGILGGSKDNNLREWNVSTGGVEKQFGPLMGPISSACYTPLGDRIMSLSVESSSGDRFRQRIWEGFGRTEVALIPGCGAVFSPNGALIASTTDPYVMSESYAGVWDMSNCLQLCSLPTDRMYLSVGLSAFGNRLVTTSLSGLNHFATEVWDAESGKHLLDLDGSNARLAQFTRDCSKIVTSEHNSGLAVWDASTGKRIRSIGLPQASRAFLLSPDGTRCLAKWAERSNWDPDNGASLVDLVTGKELIRFDGNAGGIVGFSYDGKTVSAFETPDKTSAVIWDTATCKRLRRIELAER